MQNAVADSANAPSPPKCCFWWEITRGPHENAALAFCLHRHDAGGGDGAGDGAATESLKVGRQKRCWMRLLKDLEVSSVHAEFRVVDVPTDTSTATATESTGNGHGNALSQRRVVLCDLQSTNGTKINGEPLIPRQEYALADQDLIHFGKTAVRFRVAKHTVKTETNEVHESRDQDSAVGGQEEQLHEIDLTEDHEDDLTEDHRKPLGDHPSSSPPPDNTSCTAKSDTTDPFQPPEVPAQEHAVASGGGGGGFTTDDDVFEAPRSRHAAQLPARTSLSSSPSAAAGGATAVTCMICGQWLGHLDVLEQQLHINGCLDGRNQYVENWLLPPQQGSSARTASTAQNQGKKRKRARGAAAASIEDDEVAMAMAISKSIANKEQEVDMDIALLSGELAQIDSQMAKLAKKREVLLKKMAKLEKTKAKVQKSVVIPPAEACILLDLARVLQILFPDNHCVSIDACADSASERKRARFVAEKYAPQVRKCGDSDSSRRLPSMWLRASQLLFRNTEKDLYRNSILLPFAHVDVDNEEDFTDRDKSAEANDTAAIDGVESY